MTQWIVQPRKRSPIYVQIYRFWLSIFAMGFGVGVVTGIVLSFEFWLGFAKFAQLAGPALSPLIALEVVTSFFLKAGFLGIMLFGLNRVGPSLHFASTCLVAIGATLSASWTLAADSGLRATPEIDAMRSMLLSPACWSVPEYPKFNFIQRGRRFGHRAPLEMFGSATYLTQSLQRVTRPVCVS